MKIFNRFSVFIFIFSCLNLIFIPLISLYGMRVCPVLSIPGFGFGCYYSAIYVVIANTLNLILIFSVRSGPGQLKILEWLRERPFLSYALAYFVATLTAILALQYFLHVNQLDGHSRAPEILGFSSLLLGLTQAYGLNWAIRNQKKKIEITKIPSFQRLWASQVVRTLIPMISVSAVMLHFLFSQSVEFNEGKTAPLVSHDAFINQSAYVILFLLAWLFITLTFHFLSEKDQASEVQNHLQLLDQLDFKYRSDLSQTWGLWTAILFHLNSFSKTLGERSRLLKSFSRFVTAGVAEQALHQDLKTVGSSRELTVLMSDIRNFTALAEKLTPDQVVGLLNEYFAVMLDAMTANQISVDKFMGDGILAYAETEGAPDSLVENQLCVNGALAMLEKLKTLNLALASRALPVLSIGVGIFRGPLVIGLIGSEAKIQHTIIGDTVNRAARLEGLCKELGVSIVISGHVWHSLKEEQKALFKSYGKRTMKGLSESMEVFGHS